MSALDAYQRIIDLFEKEKVNYIIIMYVKRFYVYHGIKLLEIACNEGWLNCLEEIKKRIDKYLLSYLVTNLQYPKRIIELSKLLRKARSSKQE